MRYGIAEIVNKAVDMAEKEDKVAWLVKNDSPSLRIILRIIYDGENVTLLLPNTPPPWKKNGYPDNHQLLVREARKMKIFIKGGGYDHLNQAKRENLYIKLMEDCDDEDAELLAKLVRQKPIRGLPRSVVYEAFPTLNETKLF